MGTFKDLIEGDLEEGPVMFVEDDYVLGFRLVDEEEPHFEEGYDLEIALWFEYEDAHYQIGSAYLAEGRSTGLLEFNDLEEVEDTEIYRDSMEKFRGIVDGFAETMRAFDKLAEDLDAWRHADPENPFGDTPPAKDPFEGAYSAIEEDAGVRAILDEFGVSVEDGTIKGLHSLTDAEREKMYDLLKRLEARIHGDKEDW